LLQTLALQGDGRLAAFEQRHSLAAVVSAVDAFPPGLVEGAIKRYQEVIRGNPWYFPSLRDVDVMSFLVRWGEVHAAYFELADEIFALLAKGEPLSTLATTSLLIRTIQSETMRGWVGKRSPSGLDALLDARVGQLEDLLAPLGDDAIDDVLSYGGVYIGDPSRITAEHEVVELFSAYHREVGRELAMGMLDEPNEAALSLLRGYCRYSIECFNAKYRTLCGTVQRRSRTGMSANDAQALVARLLTGLAGDARDQVIVLLDEVKALNYLNLNLEVKYSFKGWAGLMHVLVFAACSEATGISTDVYAMRNALNEEGE
jgi:hypothetical protein